MIVKLHTFFRITFIMLMSHFAYGQIDVVYSTLVWSDEFDNNGAIDSSKWFHQTKLPAGGSWFNNEVQHYTNRLSNSYVDAGNLHIVARKETFTNQNVTKRYTSARLNSKFAFKYGRVDIRAKVPNGQGTWPALWLLGKNIDEDGAYFDQEFGTTGWPACGEIDIMEHGIFSDKPKNYIGAAIHTPSSFGNTINKGGIQASDIAQNYHIYSMNWSPNQITFLLDNVAFYTYRPSVKNAATWPFDLEHYFIFNVAMGGIAGEIPSNFTQASMIVDYIRVYQNPVIDTESPTNFKASVGTVTGTSVELLLSADDNSGSMAYKISYSGGTNTVFHPSGAQKSVIISNLTPDTNYAFSISAADLSGNMVANNPIILQAKTLANTPCSGSDIQASDGIFTEGYHYSFQTIGTDVHITFELLDNRVGVVAFLRKQSPFTETQMTNVSGQKFTQTITGQTMGSTIQYAVKFAFAGGLSVTKYFSYVVGDNCSTTETDNFDELMGFHFTNPATEIIEITSDYQVDKIELYAINGYKIMETLHSNKLNVANIAKGVYLIAVYSENKKSIQKVIIQ